MMTKRDRKVEQEETIEEVNSKEKGMELQSTDPTGETFQVMPAVALRGLTVFPGMLIHFDLSREKSALAVEAAPLPAVLSVSRQKAAGFPS